MLSLINIVDMYWYLWSLFHFCEHHC